MSDIRLTIEMERGILLCRNWTCALVCGGCDGKRACPLKGQALFLVNTVCAADHSACSETENRDPLQSLCTALVIHYRNRLGVGHECCKQIADSVGHQSGAERHNHQLRCMEGIDYQKNS